LEHLPRETSLFQGLNRTLAHSLPVILEIA